MARTEYKLDKT